MLESILKVVGVLIGLIGIIVLIGGLGLLLAFPIKWTWNYVMPYLFDLRTITWGQARKIK